MPKATPTHETLVDWLLAQEEPWVIYNTRRDLLGQSDEAPEVKAAYSALKKDPRVSSLLDELKQWPQARPLSRAYDPKDSIWKLATLADFGLKRDDKRIAALAEKVLEAQGVEPNPPGFLHGGFDHTHAWDKRPYICISHVMTYALARFGYLDDPRLQRAYEYLTEWQRLDGGWHPNENNLPGGEREQDPSCPFGTVNILRAIAVNPDLCDSPLAKRGVNYILMCWERRKEPFRPIGFGMGSAFMKLQYPFVQHQLLKTVDTLSNFPTALGDKRFGQMLEAIAEKANPEELFVPEGANKPFAEFDFGQKKTPSPWMTFIVARAKHRLNQYKQAPEKKAKRTTKRRAD